jgi:hypothetical protein
MWDRAGMPNAADRIFIRIVVLLIVSGLYWQLVCGISGASEPWDADAYWRFWYPASFALAAVAGLFFPARGWLAGATIAIAQLLVMWVNSEPGSIWVFGVALSCALAVPVVAVSALTGRFAARRARAE